MEECMASLDPSTATVATWRDRVATGLMLLAAIGAFISFVTSINSVATASPATQVVEIWRMYGFLVFTGLYPTSSLKNTLSIIAGTVLVALYIGWKWKSFR